ncbi:MAG: hypothetical protein LBI65_00425 [Candidatus Symbiothrix sp.]|jgi:hypothetical protein|nr:hypothetical protein [Candidatus Symbiothrix sp.]
MTELHIDGQPVVLPKDFSFEVIRENPLFTKNGARTYEINIPLDNPQNAKLYTHLNRINNRIVLPENRNAYLVVDNEVILNGTEIILEITDREVKLQLVSGESELNFIIGGEKKINELNLGDVVGGIHKYLEYFPTTGLYYKQFAQPLFYHIVNLIIESQGYAVEKNEMETSKFRYLYLVNGIATLRYNGMLPEWTVNEFLEETEKLFNVVFLIDEFSKKVSILFKRNYYKDAQKNESLLLLKHS